MGDITTIKMNMNFFGAYSHEDNEGGIRLFDLSETPGCDTWTYGYHPPPCFPQNEKIAIGHCRYAEMWGGNVMHLEKLKPLLSKESVEWTERVQPYRGTRGVAFANEYVVANAWREGEEEEGSRLVVALSFVREMFDVVISVSGRSVGGGEVPVVRELGDVTPRKVVTVEYKEEEEGEVLEGGKVAIWTAGKKRTTVFVEFDLVV